MSTQANRQRNFEERGVDLQTRNKNEKEFFNQGAWRKYPSEAKGIDAFGIRVGEVVYDTLKKGLPQLLSEVNTQYHEASQELKILGQPRGSAEQQRKILMEVSIKFSQIVNNAFGGVLQGDFFRQSPIKAEAPGHGTEGEYYPDYDHICLRSTITTLQEEFTTQMEMYGSKYRIYETSEALGTHKRDAVYPPLSPKYDAAGQHQKEKRLDEAYEWANNKYLKLRGHGLPGLCPSELVAELFDEMSEP